ncbi:MAG: cupin domain-containing protein [Acidobacteria bacterium]|nr:cupin domain-containing protein [Acidobacteriota bacterium]
MSQRRIAFPALPWVPGTHPLERKKPAGPAGLLEFGPGFADPNWCERGHSGYVIAGVLRFEFADGTEEVGAGEGFAFEPGTRHRASNPGTVPVVLFIVSAP